MDTQQILQGGEQAMLRLRELYRRHGYLPYQMSKFEAYDLYVRNKNFLVSEQVLTFTDLDGKLMALKPDVTLSILKNSSQEKGLQKVYYNETVYRPDAGGHNFREILQAGLECIGALDSFSVGEVVMLAARSLELIRSDYLLDLSHLGIVAGLLAPLGLDRAAEHALLQAMGEKNTPALLAQGERLGLPAEVTERLCRLTLLYGTPGQILPELEAITSGAPQAQAALQELSGLCALLSQYALEDNLRLDFSIVNDMNYYSGIIFRGYLPGLASGVLAGGRYDNLLKKMGRTGGAIGFAVYLDQFQRLFSRQQGYDADVLLLYGENASPAAVAAAANAILASGRTVRVDREIPDGLRFREVRDLGKGV